MINLITVGKLLAEVPTTSTQHRFMTNLKKKKSAYTNFTRLRLMLERMDTSDVLDLFRVNESGNYDVSVWIDTGILPTGNKDPKYAFHKDSTKKNHYTTLVTISTPGKCCDDFAGLVSNEARAFFKEKLNALSRKIRLAEKTGESDSNDRGVVWEELVRIYKEKRSTLPIEDRMIVDWYMMCPEEFPPRRHAWGNVTVSRSTSMNTTPGKDYIMINTRKRTALAIIRCSETDEIRVVLPKELAGVVIDYMHSTGWRKLLFQSKTGDSRPLSDNTFSKRVTAAFKKLRGSSSIGINQLISAHKAKYGSASRPPDCA